MNVTSKLEICKNDIAKKDQTIFQLTQENHRLKDENAKLSSANDMVQTKRKKRNLTLQSNVKKIVANQAGLGNVYFYDLSFEHPLNKTVTDKIYTDMLGEGGGEIGYTENEVRAGCALYFKSQKKDEQKKTKGTFQRHRAQCRSNQRKSRKLDERKIAMNNPQITLSSEEKLFGQDILALGIEGVSSEEDPCSDEENQSDRRKRKRSDSVSRVRRVKSFYWQSPCFVDIKEKVDSFFLNSIATTAQKRVRWTRVRDITCPISDRKPPANVQPWMLKEPGLE